jgi:hypothetical protein
MTSTENIHIHLNEMNKNKIFGTENTTSTSEKYIITINDTLQANEKQHLLLIQELESNKTELEEDIENLEKKNNYLKSLLKNFHEMNKWNNELTKNALYMYTDTSNKMKMYKYRALTHLRYLEVLLFTFIAIFYEFYDINYVLNVFLMVAIVVAFQESTLMNFILPKYSDKEKRNKEIQNEIEKTEVSQDYIHEFIDNI